MARGRRKGIQARMLLVLLSGGYSRRSGGSRRRDLIFGLGHGQYGLRSCGEFGEAVKESMGI
jgi:hypothetical protein